MRKLLLASLVCFSWALTTVAQEECPPLRLRARVYPSAKRGVWAGHRAKVSVMVQSQEAVEDLAFKMELPAGLSVVKAISRPFPKTRTQPEVVQNADGTTAIYWLGVDFPHDKGSMRLFSAKLAVDACAPQTLAVTALAYLANATDLTAYCAEPLAKPAILRVRYPGVSNGRLHKHASSTPVTCAPTPAPSVNPTTPFVPLALGQRCLQAGRLAPFEDRRLSAHSDVKIERRTISDSREKRRRLGTPVVITNPTDCYNYSAHEPAHATAQPEPHSTSHSKPHDASHAAADPEPYDASHTAADPEPHAAAHPEPYDAAHAVAFEFAHGATEPAAYAKPYNASFRSTHAAAFSKPHAAADPRPYDAAHTATFSKSYAAADPEPYEASFRSAHESAHAAADPKPHDVSFRSAHGSVHRTAQPEPHEYLHGFALQFAIAGAQPEPHKASYSKPYNASLGSRFTRPDKRTYDGVNPRSLQHSDPHSNPFSNASNTSSDAI